MARQSDRWVTPGVVMVALVATTLVILAVVAAVTWLTAQGFDPDPMLRLVTQVATAVGAVGTLLLQLAGRAGQAKVERVAGRELPAKVDELADKVDRALWLDDQAHQAAYDERPTTMNAPPLPPVPDPTRPHPFPRHGAAPGTGRS